jgi:hypothetical protein
MPAPLLRLKLAPNGSSAIGSTVRRCRHSESTSLGKSALPCFPGQRADRAQVLAHLEEQFERALFEPCGRGPRKKLDQCSTIDSFTRAVEASARAPVPCRRQALAGPLAVPRRGSTPSKLSVSVRLPRAIARLRGRSGCPHRRRPRCVRRHGQPGVFARAIRASQSVLAAPAVTLFTRVESSL